jgi:hypothetical protein
MDEPTAEKKLTEKIWTEYDTKRKYLKRRDCTATSPSLPHCVYSSQHLAGVCIIEVR